MPPSASNGRFICSACGYQSSRWYGRCPECQEWNTLEEQVPAAGSKGTKQGAPVTPVILSSVAPQEVKRFSSGLPELDRALGGGFVPGSLLHLGGEPGIGKSTLLLSVADKVSSSAGRSLYISGEESLGQVKIRADRLNVRSQDLYFAAERDIDAILQMCLELKPGFLVVDSIQTCEDRSIDSLPGSPAQIRACAVKLQEYAKLANVTVILVGHTVKTGDLAGPRLLEHLVDTVLYFEGELGHLYRIIRARKNRFGATDEVAVFGMGDSGLREIQNPSEFFLSERLENRSGCCVAACVQGNRPILVEVQSLVTPNLYGSARRIVGEIDQQKLLLIAAVMSKYLVQGLDKTDIFVKVAGGVKVSEPGIDLACGIAMVSSYYNIPVRHDVACFGEIGLSGEVRMVPRMEDRVKEASRLGFSRVLVPHGFSGSKVSPGVIGVSTVEDGVRNALVKAKS
ncbi:MAG TPA: DNA repair protein RadA [Firmicutes bacterium]|nr:DNA repair protein RadA [Bacillota bacterium]